MLDILSRAPARFLPTAALGLGAVAGFYPAFLGRPARLLAALALASLGRALGSLPGRGGRLRAILLLAAGLGMAFGAALEGEEEAAAGFGPALEAYGSAGREAAAPPFGEEGRGPARLRILGAAGRLAADSRRLRGGRLAYTLEAEELILGGPGLEGSCETRGRLELLVRGGRPLAAGARLEARGSLLFREGGGVLLMAEDLALVERSAGSPFDRARAPHSTAPGPGSGPPT